MSAKKTTLLLIGTLALLIGGVSISAVTGSITPAGESRVGFEEYKASNQSNARQTIADVTFDREEVEREEDIDPSELQNDEFERYERRHEEDAFVEDYDIDLEAVELSLALLDSAGCTGGDVRVASLAIIQASELLGEEDAIDLLEEALDHTDHPCVKRMLRLRLVKLHSDYDRPDAVREHLLRLIVGT